MSAKLRTLFFWLIVMAVVVLIWETLKSSQAGLEAISADQLQELVAAGQVSEVILRDRIVEVRLHPVEGKPEGARYRLPTPADDDFILRMKEAGVSIRVEPRQDSVLLAILLTWGPVVLIVAMAGYALRRFLDTLRPSRRYR